MVRDAVAAGVTPEDALVMASFHPAQWHELDRLGAIAPGYQADLLLLPDLESFVPDTRAQARRPDRGSCRRPRSRTGCARPCGCSRSRAPTSRSRRPARRIRAIGLIDDQVVTESLDLRSRSSSDGHAVADADADLAKIAVVERHLATGRIGLGFVSGSGLQRGALASSVAHDAHNLVVVGMSDDDMAFAVAHLAEIGGGIVAVDDGRVLAECPLPVAGLLSDAPLAEVIEQQPRLQRGRRRARLVRRDAVPDARVPRALGDPVAQDHRPRPRRRRPVRDRPARGDDVTEIRTGLTYDDVLLVPRRSRVRSRQDVSTRSRFTPGIELEVPIVSANMDTVTTAPMAVAMAQLGGIGVLHRFLSVEEEAAEVRRVKRYLTHVVAEPYTIEPDRTLAEARADAAPPRRHRIHRRRPRPAGCSASSRPATCSPARTATCVEALMTPRERLVTARAGIALDEARRLLTANRIEKLPLVTEDGTRRRPRHAPDLARRRPLSAGDARHARPPARRGGDRHPRRLPRARGAS